MSFDQEPEDIHGECAHEIKMLRSENERLRNVKYEAKKLAETIDWCENNDEPVSGYIDCKPIIKALKQCEEPK